YFSILNLDNCLGYFVDGKIASTYAILSYKMFVRGVLMKMGGIAAVATKPQFRRQRHITELTKESFKVMRKNGEYISVLYPFKFSYYRKFGYENSADFEWVISPPSNIIIPKDFQPLKVREITPDESFEVLMPIREKIGSKYNLTIYDDVDFWKFHHVGKKRKLYVIEDKGENIGYFSTQLEKREGPWNVRLIMKDVIVDSIAARLTVFDFIKKHTDQNKDFSFPFLDGELATDYFDDLWDGSFKFHKSGGPMFRVVDIRKSLELLEFDKSLDVAFSMKIDDEHAPWNSEPMLVTIKNGKAKVTKTADENFDLITDIKAYTQLFVGYRTIYDLHEINKVKIKKKDLAKIDKVFPKRFTRLRTFF
ncbi:MAG: GNAT family N-acetyltransferase, partial [Asgard group archaeon]|nr:GNAT family N-acetyltransferase [Asgard group archaeon]